jgi:hypothetical protein
MSHSKTSASEPAGPSLFFDASVLFMHPLALSHLFSVSMINTLFVYFSSSLCYDSLVHSLTHTHYLRLLRISFKIFEGGVSDNTSVVVYKGNNTSKWQLLARSSRKNNEIHNKTWKGKGNVIDSTAWRMGKANGLELPHRNWLSLHALTSGSMKGRLQNCNTLKCDPDINMFSLLEQWYWWKAGALGLSEQIVRGLFFLFLFLFLFKRPFFSHYRSA